MIVKFKPFSQRTMIYRNRKKAKNVVKVKKNLTRRRFGILIQSTEFSEKDDKINFAFADLNCNLAAKLKMEVFFAFCFLILLIS